MRIISKFRDFYDSALAYGQDKSVVFVRNNTPVKADDLLKSLVSRWNIGARTNKSIKIEFSRVMVFFCGKLYRGIHCQKSISNPYGFFSPEEDGSKVFYNMEELLEYVTFNGITLEGEKRWSWQEDKILDNIEKFLSQQATTELEEYCITNRYVTLTYSEYTDFNYTTREHDPEWWANGKLLTFQFYRVYNAFQAYQELDMFISGTLPQSTQMPIEIEDKYRIPQHGFNKYSFRKSPTKDKK